LLLVDDHKNLLKVRNKKQPKIKINKLISLYNLPNNSNNDKMKRSILLIAVLFLVTSVAFGQMSDLKETITAKEKEMFEAIKNGDMDTFKSNLSENFISVYETGISDRAQELENIAKLKIRSYEFSDVRVMQPAEGIAIIAYSFNAEGTYAEEEFSGKYHAGSTWVMSDGDWKAVMHTDMEAAPMEGETVGMEENN
jgi:hypothetical protein